MQMVHDEDPKELINKKIGDISGFKVMSNQVLIGVYERPEKTKSGLYLSDNTRTEDRHQGKAGVVLAMGPKAYVSDSNYTFTAEEKVDIGDWVAIFVSDGRQIVINGQLCRLVEDQYIRLKIPAPDSVF
jgi:co-chaperonin GroES (HSP10)